MKRRMSIGVMVILVILAVMVWVVAKSQRNTIRTASVSVAAVSVPMPSFTQTPVSVAVAPEAPSSPSPIARQESTEEIARSVADGGTRHVAQPGETVTSLAADLMGKDSKTNRDAIIHANVSLQADPDKLLAGKSYHIPSSAQATADAAPTVVAPKIADVEPKANDVAPPQPPIVLKYTATRGDTVGNMAQAFLGSGDKTQQDAIINANASLRADPDRVVAGKTYRIPAPNGLSASAVQTPATSPRPTTQPDADQVVTAGTSRALRYTAKPGDTVTTLAIQLLGSDTQETRDAIINNNPALKLDPDHIVAGQTYWIPAPTPAIEKP